MCFAEGLFDTGSLSDAVTRESHPSRNFVAINLRNLRIICTQAELRTLKSFMEYCTKIIDSSAPFYALPCERFVSELFTELKRIFDEYTVICSSSVIENASGKTYLFAYYVSHLYVRIASFSELLYRLKFWDGFQQYFFLSAPFLRFMSHPLN